MPCSEAPNKAGAGNGAGALLFHVGRFGRAVPDIMRWTARLFAPTIWDVWSL